MLTIHAMRQRLRIAERTLSTIHTYSLHRVQILNTNKTYRTLSILTAYGANAASSNAASSNAVSLKKAEKTETSTSRKINTGTTKVKQIEQIENVKRLKKETEAAINKIMQDNIPGDEVGIRASFTSDHGVSEELFSFNTSQKFSMASIYKLPIIIYGLHLAEQQKLNLNATYTVSKTDLRIESPSRDTDTCLKEGQNVTLKSLLQYMIEFSCNASTDIILKLVGGTKAVEEFIQNKAQIKDINIDRTTYQAFEAMGFFKPKAAVLNLDAVNEGDKATVGAIDLLLRQTFAGKLINKDNVKLFFKMLQSSRTLDPRVQIGELAKHGKNGNKTGTVPGVLNHCVYIMEYKNENVSGKIMTTIFIKHNLNKQKELQNEITKEQRAARMEEGAKVISTAISGVYNIATTQLAKDSRQKIRKT